MQARRGAITYWKLGGETDPDVLADRFKQIGMEKHVPNRRTWLQALRAALADIKGRNQMIRPLKDKDRDGYTLVEEARGKSVNDYDCVASVAVDDSGMLNIHNGWVDYSKLDKETRRYKRLLAGRAVTDTLVSIMEECDGVPLRPSGGVYFLPESGLATWRNVCNAVREAAADNNLTVAELEINADTMRDIRDALQEEVDRLAEEAEQIAKESTAGTRMVSNRVSKAQETLERIERYEEFLDETLGGCREAVARCCDALERAYANAENNQPESAGAVFV